MPHVTLLAAVLSFVVLFRSNSRAGSTGVGEPEEEEPDWDLPPDLQEYTGNPADRKAQLAFRQAQTVCCFVDASVLLTHTSLSILAVCILAVIQPIAWASV